VSALRLLHGIEAGKLGHHFIYIFPEMQQDGLAESTPEN
jgi:hypothetical protein